MSVLIADSGYPPRELVGTDGFVSRMAEKCGFFPFGQLRVRMTNREEHTPNSFTSLGV